MPIDIDAERVVSLTEATKRLPTRRQGKRPNVATLYRWSTVGCRGVVLETGQIGGTRCTSIEALQRFVDRLTDAAGAACPAGPSCSPAPARNRARAIHAAEKRLAAAGV